MRELGFLLVVCAASGGEAAIVGIHTTGGRSPAAVNGSPATKDFCPATEIRPTVKIRADIQPGDRKLLLGSQLKQRRACAAPHLHVLSYIDVARENEQNSCYFMWRIPTLLCLIER